MQVGVKYLKLQCVSAVVAFARRLQQTQREFPKGEQTKLKHQYTVNIALNLQCVDSIDLEHPSATDQEVYHPAFRRPVHRHKNA